MGMKLTNIREFAFSVPAHNGNGQLNLYEDL